MLTLKRDLPHYIKTITLLLPSQSVQIFSIFKNPFSNSGMNFAMFLYNVIDFLLYFTNVSLTRAV
jgi:hypothetical protein